MAKSAEKIVLQVLTIAVSIPITKLTKKAIDSAWATLRPNNPPTSAKDDSVRTIDAVGWAALSAAGLVAGQVLARKASETAYRAVMGTEPPARNQKKAAKKAGQDSAEQDVPAAVAEPDASAGAEHA